MTRPCLTIPLMPLGIFTTWAIAISLLGVATFGPSGDAWIAALWGIAALAVGVTWSIVYVVSAQCDLMRRAFDLGRATARPVESVSRIPR